MLKQGNLVLLSAILVHCFLYMYVDLYEAGGLGTPLKRLNLSPYLRRHQK